MILDKSVGCYHANLRRVDEVATVIKNIEPYIQNGEQEGANSTIQRELSAPRERLHSVVEGSEENSRP